MDRRLLRYYERELEHIRHMGAEFAREYPKIAGRLGMEGINVADPFVERLLEGVAFLTARVQLKLDAEFPRFTQALLETVYPYYLAPLPSMTMIQLYPELSEPGLAGGKVVVPRGTTMRSQIAKGDTTAVEYRTAQEVQLFPIQLTEARYYTRELASLDIPPAELAAIKGGVKAAIRLRLKSTANLKFNQINLNDLALYLHGTGDMQMRLYEQIIAHTVGVVVQPLQRPARWREIITPSPVRLIGYEDDEALLQLPPASFQGYRLLQEYFAFPQRFCQVKLTGLKPPLARCPDDQVDVIILLKQVDLDLENTLDHENFALFCTPAINLFERPCDRIRLTEHASEHQVIADATRPLDFEIYAITSVTGHPASNDREIDFTPFYRARDTETAGAYYTTNRVPRMASQREQRYGPRSRYPGTEMFLSLVDAKAAPYEADLKQLSVRALCTNRDLALTVPVGRGTSDFSWDAGLPLVAAKSISGQPTAPRASQAEGEFAWRLISQLSLNYLSLTDSTDGRGAAALRDLLRLYGDASDANIRKQIEGVKSISSRPIIRRVGTPGPIAFARGLELSVTMDEGAFEGTGIFLLGAVLERFFTKYVSINSFTETVIKAAERGEVMRWPARLGLRTTL